MVIERLAPPRVKTESILTTQSAPPPRVHKNVVHVIPPDDTPISPNNIPHRYPTRFQFSQHQANFIVTENGKIYEYKHLINDEKYKKVWEDSMCPPERKEDITYPRIVVDYTSQKEKPTSHTHHRRRQSNKFSVTTETAEMTTHKLLMNSVVSTPNAKFMTADNGYFYLGTHMQRKVYIFIPPKLIPEQMIKQYQLEKIAIDGKVYVQIEKGMYGLPQAGILANQQLRQNLKPHSYVPCKHTPSLWKHVWRPIKFTLVVDDFAIMYQ